MASPGVSRSRTRSAHKADGNPYEPLPEAVRADLQAELNTLWTQFAVGRKITPAAVKKLEARCFLAPDAQRAGLVDAIAPPDEVRAEFAEQLGR